MTKNQIPTARPARRGYSQWAFVGLMAIGLSLGSTAALTSGAAAQAQSSGQETRQSDSKKESRQCFFARQVNGFRNVKGDETKILVDVGASDTYEFELLTRCPNLRFAQGIGFDQTGSGRICDGLDVDLIVPDRNFGPQRCPVKMIRRVPDE